MDELLNRLEEAREHIDPQWTEHRSKAGAVVLMDEIPRRRRRRVLAASAVGIAAAAVLGWMVFDVSPNEVAVEPGVPIETAPEAEPQQELVVAPAPVEEEVEPRTEFSDGSFAVLHGDAAMEIREESSTEFVATLSSGRVTFHVQPNAQRAFRVESGDVQVTVLGTVFSVTRSTDQTEVAVERGRVRVEWENQSEELTAGDSGVFPREPPAEPAERRSPAPMDWRSLADDGNYDEAQAALDRSGPGAVRDEARDLLLAADVARLSGNPEQAVSHLQRVMSAHGGDPRAALASFTLGRIYLYELGRAREAAASFRRAQELSPQGSLAEDALARETEAYWRAGDSSAARRTGASYLERYPEGRRVRSVRRHGGLE